MAQESVAAARYAQAWVTLAHREGRLEAGLNDLQALQSLLEHHPLLGRFLANPEIEAVEKQTVLTRVLERRVTPVALRLLVLLLWKGRLALLPAIVAEAARLRDQVEGLARGVVRSARPLPAAVLTQLAERLAHRLGRRVALTTVVDPALMGGVAVQVGHVIFDGSVRRKLEALRERLATCAVQKSERHT